MVPQWLQKKAPVADLEAEHLVNGIPFGYCNADWEALKAQMVPGDEVWTFSSPREDWERMMGWEGVALVRNSEIITFIITAMN